MSKKIAAILMILAFAAMAGNVAKMPVYRFSLSKPATVNGTVLKTGDYRLTLSAAKVSIRPNDGGTVVEATVKQETATSKFDTTVVTYLNTGTATVISEIDLGGSKTKLLFQ